MYLAQMQSRINTVWTNALGNTLYNHSITKEAPPPKRKRRSRPAPQFSNIVNFPKKQQTVGLIPRRQKSGTLHIKTFKPTKGHSLGSGAFEAGENVISCTSRSKIFQGGDRWIK